MLDCCRSAAKAERRSDLLPRRRLVDDGVASATAALGVGQLGQFGGQRRQLDAKAAGDAPRRLGGADEDANVGGEERGQIGRRVANVPGM